MGSRYEGEKAISLDTSPPRTPLLPAQTFQGQWRSSWHASPFPADRLRRLFPSGLHTPDLSPQSPSRGMACRMRLAHGRTTPTAAPGPLLMPLPFLPWPEACFLPSPLSRPPPFPPSATVVTRGLAFPFEHRRSNAFPFPQKQKAEPPRRTAPLHSGKTEPETTGVRPPDGPSRRSPPGCSRLP